MDIKNAGIEHWPNYSTFQFNSGNFKLQTKGDLPLPLSVEIKISGL